MFLVVFGPPKRFAVFDPDRRVLLQLAYHARTLDFDQILEFGYAAALQISRGRMLTFVLNLTLPE